MESRLFGLIKRPEKIGLSTGREEQVISWLPIRGKTG
jgi:hypothetical protein